MLQDQKVLGKTNNAGNYWKEDKQLILQSMN